MDDLFNVISMKAELYDASHKILAVALENLGGGVEVCGCWKAMDSRTELRKASYIVILPL